MEQKNLLKYQIVSDNDHLYFNICKSLVKYREVLTEINRAKKILEYQNLKKQKLLDTRFIRYNIKINELGKDFHINQRAKWKSNDLEKSVLNKLDFKLRRQ